MKKVGIIIVCILMLAACSQQDGRARDENKQVGFTPSEIQEVVTSPAFWGIYEGVLPPMDGSAIDVLLTINEDNTYQERLEYIDHNHLTEEDEQEEEDQIEIVEGYYTVEDSLLILFPDKGSKEYYRIENNQLRRLDDNAQPIRGLLEDWYVLNRK